MRLRGIALKDHWRLHHPLRATIPMPVLTSPNFRVLEHIIRELLERLGFRPSHRPSP